MSTSKTIIITIICEGGERSHEERYIVPHSRLSLIKEHRYEDKGSNMFGDIAMLSQEDDWSTRKRRKRRWQFSYTGKSRRMSRNFVGIVLLSYLWNANPVSAFSTTTPTVRKASLPRLHTASGSTLEDLTVKELRQRVKELSTSERGTLSRLKRKQDLVDYLKQQQQSENSNGIRNPAPTPHRRRLQPMQMPSLDQDKKKDSFAQKLANGRKTPPSSSPLSPKEAAFERVYQRYPMLREAQQTQQSTDDTTENADNVTSFSDIRQWQHPIYTHNNVTTDMDVVFVGTASCTPGVTRGVSCTALRLHWRRQSAVWNAAAGRLEHSDGNGFQGGTWLFDVGECTQVCGDDENHGGVNDECCLSIFQPRKWRITRCWHQSESATFVLSIP